MKILITGSNGLLGQKLVRQLLKKNITFLATSNGKNRNFDCPDLFYKEIDICDKKQVFNEINNFKPTHIIHTAALTNVDECELNPEKCNLINVEGSINVIEAAIFISAHFQFISTDFVFNGEKGNYSEEDMVEPLNVYAKSKVIIENYLLNGTYENYSIVRTIIVYGTGYNLSHSNLFLWTKETLSIGKNLNAVDDQFRSPTWADDLAWGCIKICELKKLGIFHLCGPETFSIYQIVKKIADYYKFPVANINKIKSSELNQLAKRPLKTGFNLDKAVKILNYKPKSIEETLDLL